MIDNELILEKLHNCEPGAEELLVENNMGLVAGIARRFLNRGYEMEDLLQIGSIGLIKAIRRFDVGFEVKFSTYAVPLIMGEIRRFIRDDGIIKVSRTQKVNAMKINIAKEKLLQSLNKSPTICDISKESGLTQEEIIEALEATNPPESLNRVMGSDDDDKELLEKIGTLDCEPEIIDKVMIKESLDILSPKERTVIILRYFMGKTQSFVSQKIGVSQVQVSRIEKSALIKMRSFFQKE